MATQYAENVLFMDTEKQTTSFSGKKVINNVGKSGKLW